MAQARGLTVFISDLRNCTNPEQERKRVEKEMAHIRSKFTGDASMSGYNRKKYVWKILYMYMLGYEVDFGHMEAVALISSAKYSEKSVGCTCQSPMLEAAASRRQPPPPHARRLRARQPAALPPVALPPASSSFLCTLRALSDARAAFASRPRLSPLALASALALASRRCSGPLQTRGAR